MKVRPIGQKKGDGIKTGWKITLNTTADEMDDFIKNAPPEEVEKGLRDWNDQLYHHLTRPNMNDIKITGKITRVRACSWQDGRRIGYATMESKSCRVPFELFFYRYNQQCPTGLKRGGIYTVHGTCETLRMSSFTGYLVPQILVGRIRPVKRKQRTKL